MVGAFHRRSGISPCGIRLSRAGTAGRRGRNGMAGRADAVSTGGLNQVSRKGAKRNGRKAGSRIISHKDTKRSVASETLLSPFLGRDWPDRSEEHTSELQSLMRTSYAVFCL